MPLNEYQEEELKLIMQNDPHCTKLEWGGTLAEDGGIDNNDLIRLADAICGPGLQKRNRYLISISIRNNSKIGESGVLSLLQVLPHSEITSVDSMNVRISGQLRQDLREAIAENVTRLAPPIADTSVEQEAKVMAQREAKRQAAIVDAATRRDQQQRYQGCVSSMPVRLNANSLRPTVIDGGVEWQPTEEVDENDEHPLTENSRRVVFRGALTDERPRLDAQRRRKQHKLRAEEMEPIERRIRNRVRGKLRQPPEQAVIHEQGRPVVYGRRGRPVASEKVVTVKVLRQRAIVKATSGGNKSTLLHIAARGTIMTQPVRT